MDRISEKPLKSRASVTSNVYGSPCWFCGRSGNPWRAAVFTFEPSPRVLNPVVRESEPSVVSLNPVVKK